MNYRAKCQLAAKTRKSVDLPESPEIPGLMRGRGITLKPFPRRAASRSKRSSCLKPSGRFCSGEANVKSAGRNPFQRTSQHPRLQTRYDARARTWSHLDRPNLPGPPRDFAGWRRSARCQLKPQTWKTERRPHHLRHPQKIDVEPPRRLQIGADERDVVERGHIDRRRLVHEAIIGWATNRENACASRTLWLGTRVDILVPKSRRLERP